MGLQLPSVFLVRLIEVNVLATLMLSLCLHWILRFVQCLIFRVLFTIFRKTMMDELHQVDKGAVTKNELFIVWKSCEVKQRRIETIYQFITNKLNLVNPDVNIKSLIMKKSTNSSKQFDKNWSKCKSENNFRKKYEDWLCTTISFEDVMTRSTNELLTPSSSGKTKQPKIFSNCTPETKRKRVEPLLQYSCEELSYALQLKLFSEGKRKIAGIIKKIMEKLDDSEIQNWWNDETDAPNLPVKMTPDEALACYVNNKMSKFQYNQLKKDAKKHNADIYPNYNLLLDAKKRCYPPNISISEKKAEVPLQTIVDFSIRKLLMVQKDVIFQLSNQLHSTNLNLSAVYKWGCDGAAGFNSYKQKILSERFDDSFLFEISFVPLEIKLQSNNSLVWKNSSPSSVWNCRPLKIIYCKETADFVKEEVAKVQDEISNLRCSKIYIDSIECTVTHSFYMTMIDGKICGFVTNTSSANCYLCGAKPSQMHQNRPVKPELLSKFGISSLHAWIKCMECMLHISYRLEIKKWQIRKHDEDRIKIRQRDLKNTFLTELGIKVDTVKQGFGTYNDGNTARRFFYNYETTARILELDVDLIRRLCIILRTISSSFKIKTDKLRQFCDETKDIYLKKYSWYYMPVTLHKILFHGPEIVASSILPIGQLSEEALEARHKDAKRYREWNTRKMSRLQTTEDLFHTLLFTSDPVINSHRNTVQKPSERIPKDVLDLLEDPTSYVLPL